MYQITGCCDHHIVAASDLDEFDSELDSIMDSIINDVYYSNVDPLSTDYIRSVGSLISNAVYSEFNFNGDFDNPNIEQDDLEFIKGLRQNTYYFVGGKNKALRQSFTELLFEGDNLRTFSKFKAECQKVGLEFNKNFLRTEYQTAISNAQSISDWRSFEDDDVLEYSAVMDSLTRPQHARLNGLQLPKSDSLWNSIAPANSWNCRCRLIVSNGKATKLTVKERNAFKKEADKEFRFNPGVTGELFPANHPYLKILTKEDKNRIDSML